jgi:arginase family enzyme
MMVAKHYGAGLSLVHFDAHYDTDKSERLDHGRMHGFNGVG